MSNHRFANVWDAIEDTPEEAQNSQNLTDLKVGQILADSPVCNRPTHSALISLATTGTAARHPSFCPSKKNGWRRQNATYENAQTRIDAWFYAIEGRQVRRLATA